MNEKLIDVSIRDWLAAQALQGMLASATRGNGYGMCPDGGLKRDFKRDCARDAYKWADAMLEARNERG